MSVSSSSSSSSSSSRSRVLCAPRSQPAKLSGKVVPDDIILLVFSFLKTKEICGASGTDRSFYDCGQGVRRQRALKRLPVSHVNRFSVERAALSHLQSSAIARCMRTSRDYAAAADALLRERTIAQFEQAGVIDLFGGRPFLQRLPHYSRLSFLGDYREIAMADLDRVQEECGSSIILVGDLHMPAASDFDRRNCPCGILMFVNDKSSLLDAEAFSDIGESGRLVYGSGFRTRPPIYCLIFSPRGISSIQQLEIHPGLYTLAPNWAFHFYNRTGVGSFFSRLCHRMSTGVPIHTHGYSRHWFQETMPTVRETYTTTVTRDRCCCGESEETVQREREVPTLSLTDALPPTAVPYMPPPPAGPDLPPSS